ncbi:MAG: amidohydrolase family protein [Planctomycetes bacterium]|nr:amidohydrolase family protein [Planctomycetota bacterium]
MIRTPNSAALAAAVTLALAVAVTAQQNAAAQQDGRAAAGKQTVTAYTHARILPGGKPAIADGVLVVGNGKVLAVGDATLRIPDGAVVVDCSGKTITPGLIDAAFAGGASANDLNEQSEEVTPALRVLDSLDPEAPAFARARRDGVTTVHVMPGTRNVIGGLGCVVKTAGDPTSMIVKQDASLRITLGAEPSMGNRSIGGGPPESMYYRRPTTRMGVVWEVRRAFYDAKEALQMTQGAPNASPPSEGVEILTRVLQGKLTAVTTARSEQDLRTALRIADEFGYETVIDEAQDAYLVADELAQKKATVLLGAPSAEQVGGTAGSDGASPRSGTVRALAERSVRVVVTTGTNALALPLVREAMFANRNGLGPQQALDAVTVEPARLLGIDDRTGRLAAGLDADFVIWSTDPLDPAAVAESVHIDGNPAFTR